jgi:RNA polymerase sigma factor (sigma-70 family)
MKNPFSENNDYTEEEQDLINRAVDGDRSALENLIALHQGWIYNIALRMVWYPPDAEDITQEVLIKMITNLGTFRGRSRFRTWLYRILVNYVLKTRKRAAEKNWFVQSFDEYGKSLDQIPDSYHTTADTLPIEADLLVKETRLMCKMGMLLCLNRDLRIAFIFGAIFRINENIGSEIMGITSANYRQRISRARKKIDNFLNDRCELVNNDNPCRCYRKTKALIELGNINPKQLLFNSSDLKQVKEVVEEESLEFGIFGEERCDVLFRQDPFQNSPDFVLTLRSIVNESFYGHFN